jgi:Protein of unknown function (DUF2550)
MIIALLAVLGVDLIVLVALAAGVIGRRRWLKCQPGDFQGAIRVTGGDVDGLGPKWKRGHGRWVRDVLVWSKAPLMIRNELVPIDRLAGERAAKPGEVKRLGDSPLVVELSTNGATVQIAAKKEHRALAVGPFMGQAAGVPPVPPPPSAGGRTQTIPTARPS